MSEQKTYVVLSMGRSSSSFISKALHDTGINMGDDLLQAGKGNIYGHYEDKDFLRYHEDIFLQSGGSWSRPPLKYSIDKDKVKKLIEARNNKYDYWGFKDPRTITFIDDYYDLLRDPIMVCLFRDIDEVAKSLNQRDGTSIEEGRSIAINYNKKLIEFLKKRFT